MGLPLGALMRGPQLDIVNDQRVVVATGGDNESHNEPQVKAPPRILSSSILRASRYALKCTQKGGICCPVVRSIASGSIRSIEVS